MRWILAISTASLLATGTAAGQPVDPWANGNGPVHAENLIRQCTGDHPWFQFDLICVRSPFEACQGEHGLNQQLMNECAQSVRVGWMSYMDNLLARARSLVDPSHRQELEDSQAAWASWTQTTCNLVRAGWAGGSIQPTEVDQCLAEHAAFRAVDLQYLTHWWGH